MALLHFNQKSTGSYLGNTLQLLVVKQFEIDKKIYKRFAKKPTFTTVGKG